MHVKRKQCQHVVAAEVELKPNVILLLNDTVKIRIEIRMILTKRRGGPAERLRIIQVN